MFSVFRTGRKKPIICFLLLCGVMNIVTIFVPPTTGLYLLYCIPTQLGFYCFIKRCLTSREKKINFMCMLKANYI